jgi:hypothetical protein
VRATLGQRPESEELILPLVKNLPPRSVNVVVPPGNGPWGWMYPDDGVRSVVRRLRGRYGADA